MREAQYQFNEGALLTISENRPLMGSTARECRMQALVGNGSPAIKLPDQETLKGSPLNRLTTTSDEAVHMERVAMKSPGSRTSVYAAPR